MKGRLTVGGAEMGVVGWLAAACGQGRAAGEGLGGTLGPHSRPCHALLQACCNCSPWPPFCCPPPTPHSCHNARAAHPRLPAPPLQARFMWQRQHLATIDTYFMIDCKPPNPPPLAEPHMHRLPAA